MKRRRNYNDSEINNRMEFHVNLFWFISDIFVIDQDPTISGIVQLKKGEGPHPMWCTIALGMSGIFWLYLIFMGIFGVAMPFFNTPATVFIQEHVEESFMGRVFSINTMLFTSIMPLGMLIFGPVVEIVRIEWILIITGLLMLIQTLIVLRNRNLIRAGEIRGMEN